MVSRMRLELTRTSVHYPLKVARLPIPPPRHFGCIGHPWDFGAKNGTRTRDPDLGKVVLYQLSYFRIYCSRNVIASFCECKFNPIFYSMQIFEKLFIPKVLNLSSRIPTPMPG